MAKPVDKSNKNMDRVEAGLDTHSRGKNLGDRFADPLNLFGDSSMTANAKHFGGSQEYVNAQNNKLNANIDRQSAGAGRSRNAMLSSAARQERQLGEQNKMLARTGAQALAGSTALGNEIASNARNASRDYQQTSNAQFRAQTDANQRAALSLGARGGAAGIRDALSQSMIGNQQAQSQATITQAQELNNIMQMKQEGLASANNIRNSGIDRQVDATKGISTNIGNAAQTTIGAQNSVLSSQLAERGQDQNYSLGMNTTQLTADLENEKRRQAAEKHNDRGLFQRIF